MAADLFAGEDLVEHLRSKWFFGEVENGRETDDHTGVKTVSVSSSLGSGELLVDDHLADGQLAHTW